jgi:tRNA modification GTPase
VILYIEFLPLTTQEKNVSLAHEVDTIAAIATPPGEGGISVIRVSGEKATGVADKGFRGKDALQDVLSHTAHYGSFLDQNGAVLDYVVALVLKAPHSYTGEDTVELSCHGGQLVVKKILESLIRFGARPAEAGEFTKRAFLNGRMDLVQAEAVVDLIKSRSDRAHQTSVAQLEGGLSKRVLEIRDQLVESVSFLELELDFAEDGYEFVNRQKVAGLLQKSIEGIDTLLVTYSVGKIYRNGVRVALVGSPNVGKSSLLNALLRQERAIVTNVPGTTRDVIEESISIGGLLFNLGDTAGLRKTDDPVEKEGVKRAEDRLVNSDVIILILDGSRELNPGEAAIVAQTAKVAESGGKKCIVAVNKVDLAPYNPTHFKELDWLISGHRMVGVSARTLEGIDRLEQALHEVAVADSVEMLEEGVMITNLRHYSALERAKNSLVLSLKTVEAGNSSEFVAVDLHAALDALGEVTGAVTTEDILNSIFSKFCIGK